LRFYWRSLYYRYGRLYWRFYRNAVADDLWSSATVLRQNFQYNLKLQLPLPSSSQRLSSSYCRDRYGLQLSNYVGWEVFSIDGIPVLAYMNNFTIDQGFVSKDIGTLFNYALDTQLMNRTMLINDFPTNPVMTFELYSQGTTVRIA
jgi:hypothetical protein